MTLPTKKRMEQSNLIPFNPFLLNNILMFFLRGEYRWYKICYMLRLAVLIEITAFTSY